MLPLFDKRGGERPRDCAIVTAQRPQEIAPHLHSDRLLGSARQNRLLPLRTDGRFCGGQNRVPILIPCAPRTRAAASPRPSAMPPAAITGMGLTASTTWGIKASPATVPTKAPASLP